MTSTLRERLVKTQERSRANLHHKFYKVILNYLQEDIDYKIRKHVLQTHLVYIIPDKAVLNNLLVKEFSLKDVPMKETEQFKTSQKLALLSLQVFMFDLIQDITKWLHEQHVSVTAEKCKTTIPVGTQPMLITINNQLVKLQPFEIPMYKLTLNWALPQDKKKDAKENNVKDVKSGGDTDAK